MALGPEVARQMVHSDPLDGFRQELINYLNSSMKLTAVILW